MFPNFLSLSPKVTYSITFYPQNYKIEQLINLQPFRFSKFILHMAVHFDKSVIMKTQPSYTKADI